MVKGLSSPSVILSSFLVFSSCDDIDVERPCRPLGVPRTRCRGLCGWLTDAYARVRVSSLVSQVSSSCAMPIQPAEIVEPLNEPSALVVVCRPLPDVPETATVGASDKSRERKFGFVLCSMDSVRVPASRTSMEACELKRNNSREEISKNSATYSEISDRDTTYT